MVQGNGMMSSEEVMRWSDFLKDILEMISTPPIISKKFLQSYPHNQVGRYWKETKFSFKWEGFDFYLSV